jgi:hypothetical protein
MASRRLWYRKTQQRRRSKSFYRSREFTRVFDCAVGRERRGVWAHGDIRIRQLDHERSRLRRVIAIVEGLDDGRISPEAEERMRQG